MGLWDSHGKNWVKTVTGVFDQVSASTEYVSEKLGRPEELLSSLKSSLSNGISTPSIALRQQEFGYNYLTLWTALRPNLRFVMSDTFLRFVVVTCAVSSVSKYAFKLPLDFWTTFIVFLAALLLSLLGLALDFYIDFRIAQMRSYFKYSVIRDGHRCKILSKDLVTGDIIHLKQGEVVPADIFILESEDLSVNDSLYTGKIRNGEFGEVLLRSNSEIVDGKVVGVVLAVGENRNSYRRFGTNVCYEDETEIQRWINGVSEKWVLGVLGFGIFVMAAQVFFMVSEAVKGEWSLETHWIRLLDTVLLQSVFLVIALLDIGKKIPYLVFVSGFSRFSDLAESFSLEKFEKLSHLSSVCIDITNLISSSGSKVQSLCIGKNTVLNMNELYQVSNNNAESLVDTLLVITHVTKKQNSQDQTIQALEDLMLKFDSTKKSVDPKFVVKQFIYEPNKKSKIFIIEFARTIKIYVYGPSKHILKLCNCTVTAEGRQEDFLPSEKRFFFKEFVEPKQQSGLKLFSFAVKSMTLQEWVKIGKETGEVGLDLILSSLAMFFTVGISTPIDSQVITELKKVSQAGLEIRLMTEDSVKTAVSIASTCGILPAQYKLQLEDKYVISGDDLIINCSILASSPRCEDKNHEANKRISGIKLLAEANAEQKQVFIEKLCRLTGEIGVVKRKYIEVDFENEFKFRIHELKMLVEAIGFSKFAYYAAVRFVNCQIEMGATVFCVFFVYSVVIGEIAVEFYKIFWIFYMILYFEMKIMIKLKPIEEEVKEKINVNSLEFDYKMCIFRVIVNVLSVLLVVYSRNSFIEGLYENEKVSFNGKIVELIGNSNQAEKIRDGRFFYCLKSILYIGIFSMFFQGRFGKGNLVRRVFMCFERILIAEIVCLMGKPEEIPNIDANMMIICGLGAIIKIFLSN